MREREREKHIDRGDRDQRDRGRGEYLQRDRLDLISRKVNLVFFFV